MCCTSTLNRPGSAGGRGLGSFPGLGAALTVLPLVYYGVRPWNGPQEVWLRGQRFTVPGLQLVYDTALETVLLTVGRRDRLDRAITEMAANSEYTAVVRRLCSCGGCPRRPGSVWR